MNRSVSYSKKAHLPQLLSLIEEFKASLMLFHVSISHSRLALFFWLTESLVVPKLNSSHSHCCQFSALLLNSPFFIILLCLCSPYKSE